MNSIALAFTIIAVISGTALFGAAFDTIMYDYAPKPHRRAMVCLTIATLVFSWIATITSGKGCEDFTVDDYENGNVPISCPAQNQSNKVDKEKHE
jgi:hypothetical protein